jgi:tRNA(fMet)-specific endonuclease VapC
VTLRYLLDTSVVSSPISRAPDADLVARLEEHGAECAIAAPVWHELTLGCRRLPAGRRREALEAYLRDVVQAAFPVLPYDAAAAAWHAEERTRLEKQGRPLPFVDAQIAAIAHVNRLELVTLNTRDFAVYKDLDVGSWSRRRGRAAPAG